MVSGGRGSKTKVDELTAALVNNTAAAIQGNLPFKGRSQRWDVGFLSRAGCAVGSINSWIVSSPTLRVQPACAVADAVRSHCRSRHWQRMIICNDCWEIMSKNLKCYRESTVGNHGGYYAMGYRLTIGFAYWRAWSVGLTMPTNACAGSRCAIAWVQHKPSKSWQDNRAGPIMTAHDQTAGLDQSALYRVSHYQSLSLRASRSVPLLRSQQDDHVVARHLHSPDHVRHGSSPCWSRRPASGEPIATSTTSCTIRLSCRSGEEGWRSNVRSIIKRVRAKFKKVDPKFDRIKNYSTIGYCWED